MWVTSLSPVRRLNFELFFYTHQLYIIFVVFLRKNDPMTPSKSQCFPTSKGRPSQLSLLTCKSRSFLCIQETSSRFKAQTGKPTQMMLPASVKNAESSSILPDQTCQSFTLAEIQLMTHNFDEALVIGRGGFGKVYKTVGNRGPSKNGSVTDVAIKRLHSMSSQGAREFWAEVEMLSKLRHCNLVSLIGYCNEEQEMILVYEFMPNGTLEDHLHKANTGLSWLQRLKICIAAGRGIDYLHTGTGTQHGVIHRDVKSSNILLDANFSAKISDFGLAKIGPINQTRTHVSTEVKGTFGYMDPFYFYIGKLTRKSDVYAFGVVLFEVLCGRQAVDITLDEDQWGLTVWAQEQINEGKLNKIVDSRLMGKISKRCLKEFASIAVNCLDNQPKRRPTMAEVVVKLESILSLHERENFLSVADEGMFNKMVRSFFSAKAVLMPARPMGSKSENSADIQKSSSQSIRTFTYDELASATRDFEHQLDSPSECVTVYEGWVDEKTYSSTEWGIGLMLYIWKMHIQISKEVFRLEEFNHPNVGNLLGYCLHKQELFCVYEFISGASLDRHLFGEPGTPSLSWVARLKIAVGAARGLSFLHQRNHAAYSQFKTSVILLDTDFNARLSDYVLEKSFLVDDSYFFNIDAFYAAPEWFSYQVAKLDGFSRVSQSNDDYFGVTSEIYSFGVVLLEILTGLKVYDVNRPQGKQNLVKWAAPLLADEMNLVMIMDPKLQENNHPPKGAFKLALLVSKCLQPIEEKRPSMEEIIQVLYHSYQDETKSI